MTLDEQLLTMFNMIIGGFYLGVAYDTYRWFTPYFKERTFLVYFLEITFWLLQSSLLFFLLYQTNDGQLRLYVFLACLLGFSIYKACVAPFYNRLLTQMMKGIAKVLRFIINTIMMPFHWIIAVGLMLGQVLLKVFLFLILPIRWLLRPISQKVSQIISKKEGFYSIMKKLYKKLSKFIPFLRR